MRSLDEIRRERETLAAAEPFAELAETARHVITHLESVEAAADMVSKRLQRHEDEGLVMVQAFAVRSHILDDYRKLADELHAAVDRVMRTSLIDKAATWTPPQPEPESEPKRPSPLREDLP